MMAVELVRNGNPAEPDPALTRRWVQSAARRGLVILACGPHGNVIRLLAPLTIGDDLLDEGLQRLEASLEEALGEPASA
jgi:4-aminobutyrate aminotransferase/(S)-3-amino-2-methylpropionate transaminase